MAHGNHDYATDETCSPDCVEARLHRQQGVPKVEFQRNGVTALIDGVEYNRVLHTDPHNEAQYDAAMDGQQSSETISDGDDRSAYCCPSCQQSSVGVVVEIRWTSEIKRQHVYDLYTYEIVTGKRLDIEDVGKSGTFRVTRLGPIEGEE